MPTCFFIGHREAPDALLEELTFVIEQHITEYQVNDFVVGQYGRFDALAAKGVLTAKRRHPEVTLTLLLPYHPYDRPIPLPSGFDGTFYPPGMEAVPKRAAIVRANRYMVEHSAYLIAYAWHPASNARKITEYAKSQKFRNSIIVTELSPR